MKEKTITLSMDESPKFVGAWKIGEVMALLAEMKRWIENIPLSSDEQNAKPDQVT